MSMKRQTMLPTTATGIAGHGRQSATFPWYLALCLSYPVIRYASDSATVVASLAVLMFILFTIVRRVETLRATSYIMAPLSLVVAAAIGAIYVGDKTSFRYLAFCCAYLPLAFAVFREGDGDRSNYQPMMICGIGIICLAFWIFPQLPQYDDYTQVNYFIDENERSRLRAIFAHANDLGISAAGFYVLMAHSISRRDRSISKALHVSALLISLILVFASRSSTGYFVVATGTMWRLINPKKTRIILVVCFIILSALQLRFYDVAMDFLESGSFWWRFTMAERVDVLSGILTFQPTMVSSQETWTHSLLLDISIVYGRLAVYLIVCLLAWFGAVGAVNTVIAVFIPLITACIQPPGATPAALFILIVICFSIAHRLVIGRITLLDAPTMPQAPGPHAPAYRVSAGMQAS
jgi:hypothetical protein